MASKMRYSVSRRVTRSMSNKNRDLIDKKEQKFISSDLNATINDSDTVRTRTFHPKKKVKVDLVTSKKGLENELSTSLSKHDYCKATSAESSFDGSNMTPDSKEYQFNNSESETLLLDIGPLVKGTLIKRPSATIQSPYVADVQLNSSHSNKSTHVLAHAPALNVGGLCVPNKTVYLSTRDKQDSKTSHAIELVVSLGRSPSDHDVLVGAHPRLAELLVEKVLMLGLIKEGLEYDGPITTQKRKSKSNEKVKNNEIILKKQYNYGDSRMDFAIQTSSKLVLIEVKNVVCADYHESYAPPKPKRKSDNVCVITSNESIDTYERSGLFPWGKVTQTFEGKKVVSERAIKHVRNLASIVKAEEGGVEIQPIIIFVINRGDCNKMRLCHEVCPTFAEEVRIAREKGVIVACFSVRWTSDGKAYFNGIVPVDV